MCNSLECLWMYAWFRCNLITFRQPFNLGQILPKWFQRVVLRKQVSVPNKSWRSSRGSIWRCRTRKSYLRSDFRPKKFRKRFFQLLPDQLLFHSDHGIQYTANDFRSNLSLRGIEQSMSEKGQCWDNTLWISWGKLKIEWGYHNRCNNIEKARISLFEYIEGYYYNERFHQALGNKTPCKWVKSIIIERQKTTRFCLLINKF